MIKSTSEHIQSVIDTHRERIKELEEENERLLSIKAAAMNLVNNSYTPSCDGDRQRWMMLQAALRGEGE